jgi:uncharacterized protein (TIGR02284 family)
MVRETREGIMAERSELGVLNHLLETCRDGERGFRFAVAHATEPDVKSLFTALAEERARFAEELAPHVRRLGGQASGAGTAAGAIHRGWMNLRDAMSRHHDDALLGEAERGERAAIHTYREALQGMLPPTVSDIVERQHAAIRGAHGRIVAFDSARQYQM